MNYTIETFPDKHIFETLNLSESDEFKDLNYSCKYFLNQAKQDIEYDNKSWDIYKKYTNPYEYIHGSVDGIRLSKIKPLSRAFYKLYEIMNDFNIFENKKENSINTFHIAEGPGGFIQATDYYRKYNSNYVFYNNDKYRGMTLIDKNDKNVPGWFKAEYFIKNNPNIIIENCSSNDGNLYLIENLDYIFYNYKNKFDFVTADGGFDFTKNFNNQEQSAMKLIIYEIIYGIITTCKNGHFVVKTFDLFTKTSYELIYVLSRIFKDVNIYKPKTSRLGNSEKYIICKYKLFDIDESQYSYLRSIFEEISLNYNNYSEISILNKKLPSVFINSVNELNCMFVERQLYNINETINLIRNNKKYSIIQSLKHKNTKLCEEWFTEMNLSFNFFKRKNIFTKN